MLLVRVHHATYAWKSMNFVVIICPWTQAGIAVLMLYPPNLPHMFLHGSGGDRNVVVRSKQDC